MAGALCQSLPAAKALFDRAATVLGYDLLDVCVNGPAERLNATDVSQPAIFVASLAALEQLKATEPDAFADVVATAGLSLGEYTALVVRRGAVVRRRAAGGAGPRRRRCRPRPRPRPSGMVSVLGLELPEVEALVAEARPAGHAGGRQLALPRQHRRLRRAAGDRADRADCAVEKGGIRTVRLAVAGAFHTDLMKPADEKLAEALAGVTVAAPRGAGVVERGREAAHRPGRDPRPAGAAGALAGAVGRDDAGAARRRASSGSTRSARAGCWRAAEAGQPEGRHPEHVVLSRRNMARVRGGRFRRPRAFSRITDFMLRRPDSDC